MFKNYFLSFKIEDLIFWVIFCRFKFSSRMWMDGRWSLGVLLFQIFAYLAAGDLIKFTL